MPIYPRNLTVSGWVGSKRGSYSNQTGYGSYDEFPRPWLTYQRIFSQSRPAPGALEWRGALDTYAYSQTFSGEGIRHQSIADRKAYDRFKELAYDNADAGLLAAERKEALGLIAQRAWQIYKSFVRLQDGNFRGFLKELRVRPLNKDKRTKWTRPRDASAIWLEYWFGWSPLINDIGNVIEVLQGEIPDLELRAGGFSKGEFRLHEYYGPSFYRIVNLEVKARTTYWGRVRVTNPNLALANQLGFVNPATIVWELIPFSFLVDWFIPVGDFLSQSTDWVGMELVDKRVARKRTVSGVENIREYDTPSVTHSDSGVFNRSTSWDVPGVVITPPNGLSMTRAATAISLVVGLFTKG